MDSTEHSWRVCVRGGGWMVSMRTDSAALSSPVHAVTDTYTCSPPHAHVRYPICRAITSHSSEMLRCLSSSHLHVTKQAEGLCNAYARALAIGRFSSVLKPSSHAMPVPCICISVIAAKSPRRREKIVRLLDRLLISRVARTEVCTHPCAPTHSNSLFPRTTHARHMFAALWTDAVQGRQAGRAWKV